MTESDNDNRPYRLGVGIVLFNADGQVFVGRRKDTVELAWQFPQGGIDKGEDPLQAAWREMSEEIGTDKAQLIGQSKDWLAYDLPPDLAAKSWGGKYRGQKQMWYAFRFVGKDSDIDLETHTPEFAEWKWMDLAGVPDCIVAFKRPLYIQVVAEFLSLTGQ
jgi:putative (di)nucleoside polyphosphate hydrolase